MINFFSGLPEKITAEFFRISGLYFYDQFTMVLVALDKSWNELAQYNSLRSELYRMKCFSLAQLGQFSASLRAYSEILTINADDPYARKNIGPLKEQAIEEMDALVRKQHWSRLKQLASVYLHIEPDHPKVRWYEAVAIDELGDPKAAEVVFRSLVQECPTDSFFARSHVLSLAHAGDLVEATRACAKALEYFKAHGRTPGDLPETMQWLESQNEENNESPRITVEPHLIN